MMPISVMPTWTPDKKRPGLSASARARTAPRVAGFRHLLQADASRGHNRQLRHSEEAVEQDQPNDDGQFEPDGHNPTYVARRNPLGNVRDLRYF